MLRLRLILWYSLLVVLTISAIGLAQNFLIKDSLFKSLDSSLVEDAEITLSLISTLPPQVNPQEMVQHGAIRTSNLRELVDHALAEVPDSTKGTALGDRVVNSIVDQILTELSFEDSAGKSADPLDAIVDRTVSSRRNNLVEIYALTRDSAGTQHQQNFFRTKNLGQTSLRRLLGTTANLGDSAGALGTVRYHHDRVRVAVARNARFVVYVGYPITDINESLSSLRSSFFFLVPLALLVSILGGLWLARKALRPIEQIADTASDISAKNLSQRIELPGRTDHELVTLTRTLNSMFGRLESSFQQVAQFTSDASHELKTPLAIMRGEIEQAQRHLERIGSLNAEEDAELLQSLTEEVDRMQRIVEGLLLLSRADDRKLPLDLERIPIYHYLESLCEDASILAEERRLSLKSDLDARTKELFVSADSTRLYQVVMNLLDNALKYTPPGGTVTLFLHRSADYACFGVADTGIGIAEEDLSKVFRRFYRTDEARSGPHEDSERSLGLGLAIVKSIVEAQSGTIEVESTHGKGTRFTIKMPIMA